MSELNRRLKIGEDIIYPITKAENVIHLQKEIKDKLPIVSDEEPEEYVERQVWLDTSEEEVEEEIQTLSFERSVETSSFVNSEEPLVFGTSSNNDVLSFGTDEEELLFGHDDEELTFGDTNNNEELSFEN